MKRSVFQALAEAACSREPVALGVISGVKGSSPQKVGAKALFYSDGRIESTLGGGCLEAEVQQRAIQSLHTGQASTFDLLLDHDFGWDDGLICGGKVHGIIVPNAQIAGEAFWSWLGARQSTMTWGIREDFSFAADVATAEQKSSSHQSEVTAAGFLYREIIRPPWNLWIAGAGHIAQAVAPLAVQVDFKVTVFDDRPALANRKFFPEPIIISSGDWPVIFAAPFPQEPTLGLIVTRGHRHDALVLRDWIAKPFGFLGMIGSARKARIIFEHFLEEKIATQEQLARVACPVGINIESRTVEEIAVSIVARFIQKRAELMNSRS